MMIIFLVVVQNNQKSFCVWLELASFFNLHIENWLVIIIIVYF